MGQKKNVYFHFKFTMGSIYTFNKSVREICLLSFNYQEKYMYFDLIMYACTLTHLILASFLWDIGKQHSPRCDAAERGVPSVCLEKFNPKTE